MKAIFAVSALAAAISAQAIAADTEATTTYTGGVKVEFTQTLANEDGSDPTPASAFGENGDDTKLEASVSVVNGPFSGTIKFTDGDEVEVSDLKVDNGTFAFGSVGGIISTEGAVDGMADSASWSTDTAFRYTNTDLGLKVQIEEGKTERKGDLNLNADPDGIPNSGDEDTDTLDEVEVCTNSDIAGDIYDRECEDKKEWEQVLDSLETAGLAVAYTSDFGVASVTADAQYRVTAAPLIDGGASTGNEAAALYYGVKVVSSPVEMLTLTAGYTSGHGDDFSDASDTVTSYGVQADVTVMEGVSAYASYADKEGSTKTKAGVKAVFAPITATVDWVADDETTAKVSAEQAMDALTLSGYGQYKVEAAEFEAQAKVAYALSDMTSASAQVTSFNGDNLEFIANVTHKLEDGISLMAEYENDDREGGNDKDGRDWKNAITLSASYSF